MKTKLMKKMIALICAAAMTTSCAAASVGAFKAPERSSQNLVDGVAALNVRLNSCEADIQRVYDKLNEMFVEAERKRYVGKNDDKNYEKHSVSHISRYIFKQIKDHLMRYDIGWHLKLEDLIDKTIYNNDDVNEISKMLDTLEGHVKVLCDKIDGVSPDWDKNCVTYTKKESNGIPLKEDEKDNKKILKYGGYQLQDFIKPDVLKVAADIKKMVNKAEEGEQKQPFIVNLNQNKQRLEIFRLQNVKFLKFFEISGIPISENLKTEIKKLTGRDNITLKISSDRDKEFRKNIASLKFANSQIIKVINMLKINTAVFLTTPEMTSKIIERTRSIVNSNIDKMLEEDSLEAREGFTTDEEQFKFKEINDKFRQAIDYLKEWENANKDSFKKIDSSDKFKEQIEDLQDQYTQIITLYTTNYSNLSQEEWVEKVKSQAEEAKKALNTLLENMSKKVNQNNQNQG